MVHGAEKEPLAKEADGARGEEGAVVEVGEGEDSVSPKPLIGTIGVDYRAADYLRDRRRKVEVAGNLAMTHCPVCVANSKRRKLTLEVEQDLGLWSCRQCGRKGTFSDLRRLLKDTPLISTESPGGLQFEVHTPAYTPVTYFRDYTGDLQGEKGEGARSFLTEMGITEELIERLRIGYCAKTDALAFPYLYSWSTNSCSYLRFLRLPVDWWKAAGQPRDAAWFGQHLFKAGFDEAVVVHTPLDAAVLMAMGESNVLASHGDIGASRLRSHHLALLHRCSLVYLVPDPTDRGAKWASSVQEQIGRWRCRIVQLDTDARHLISNGQEKVWEAAKKRSVSSLGTASRKASHWISDLDEEFGLAGVNQAIPTQLEPLDKLLGGFRAGELTVLSGRSGVGKSTFAAFLGLLQASEERPVLHMSFEVLPKAVVKKWIVMLAGKPFDAMDRATYVAARRKLAKRPLFVADTYGMIRIKELRRSVYDAVTRRGVKFVVLDHLEFLTSMASSRENTNDQTAEMMREIKRWALDLGVHVMLLAHLRKQSIHQSQFKRASMEDLKGAGAVYQISDNVVLLDRGKRGEDGDPTMLVRLEKVRDDVGYEGSVTLGFERWSLRYSP